MKRDSIDSSCPAVSVGFYEKDRLQKVAFPLGGIGTGMICIEGTGAFTSVALRHHPALYNEPFLFSALSVKQGSSHVSSARVLAGPVPGGKLIFPWGEEFYSSGDGARGKSYGFPHFDEASFSAQFPFAKVRLSDPKVPLTVDIRAWNPFIPNDADASSLPVAGLEYTFSNPSLHEVEAVYSFHSENFMSVGKPWSDSRVTRTKQGFVLEQPGHEASPWDEGYFTAWIDEEEVHVNPAWFRGGWFDAGTMVWKSIQAAECIDQTPAEGKSSSGASLSLPFRLAPGEEKTVILKWAWYVPFSDQRWESPVGQYHRPWYAEEFANLGAVEEFWRKNYESLRTRTETFSRAFYDSTLPPEIIDAVAANLTILKSPTVLRQADGRIWTWEGCHDKTGSCAGSCTHVWNYAQAMPHLFAELERGLRETEFFESQNDLGHQNFRICLPIAPRREITYNWYAAADGQLGGILKAYREWRISGDKAWLQKLWPRIKQSLDYCILSWDPTHQGLPSEPHHNTYDIEFWGENGMCGSFYLGALASAIEMAEALEESVPLYKSLLEAGRKSLEERLFNGEYFYQDIRWTGLVAQDPTASSGLSDSSGYSPEALALLEKEGPKYQYGQGCLSDGIIGAWMGWAAGLPPFLDESKVGRHLDSVFKYNFREDLSEHANPQRAGYALGHEGGLLLCTWPNGNRLTLPMPYSEEVWTGIEYQVAAHLISLGRVDEGLQIVRAVRARYDGKIRNPFNEFECGHWYARAMSSYSLLQAVTGARYDAVEKTLNLAPQIKGDFRTFLSTATGFGTVGLQNGQPLVEIKAGWIDIKEVRVHGVLAGYLESATILADPSLV